MKQELSKALYQGDNTPVVLQGIQQDFTITSLEIAEMMEVPHYDVLRKLEGCKKSDGTIKIKGIIPTLIENELFDSDYFIKTTYIDKQGKVRKCYDCTKLGCGLLSNKFNKEKGIIFTAKYVKRFKEEVKNAKECTM